MRCTIADLSGSPGTMGVTPDLVGLTASSRRSRRRPAIRAALSGPWQRKQVSAMIGRISRLKRISPQTAVGKRKNTANRGCGKRRNVPSIVLAVYNENDAQSGIYRVLAGGVSSHVRADSRACRVRQRRRAAVGEALLSLSWAA